MKTRIALACLLSMVAATTMAQEQVLNIYSARHYPTDEALYANFTKTTGIKLNRVDADDAGILARLKAEGTASPADIILLVDASRLWRGEIDGLFQSVKSKVLDDAIPAQYRGKANASGETPWFGFSTRARVIVYDKLKVKKEDVDTYEELGDAKNRDNAIKFLEYLASAEAQNYFANGNNEWPAAKGLHIDNPALKAMTGSGSGSFKSETIPISAVGANVTKVQQMLDRVGFQ